ncbi:hypothetical protein [Belliella pelovolcani]|uniref:hypothetical protein n=1 Tax=Belliella pelovolcani TaxID=529505 RepID=UPI00391DE430
MRNINHLFILIGLSLLLLSCQKEMELVFTIPDFNPPIIASIDTDGVESICEINNFGSLPIEEYGFMYSSSSTPRPENAEIISLQGRPDKRFRSKATHNLQPQVTNYIVAYIKTSEGYIFTEDVPFTSQGANGFKINKVDVPTPLYFGDTIQVIGEGFSRMKKYYKITLNSYNVDVFDTSESGFKFILPESILQDNTFFSSSRFSLKVDVFLKKEFLEIPFTFQEPIFDMGENKSFNFDDGVVIRGKYLATNAYPIKILNHDDIFIPAEFQSDSTIVLSLKSDFPTASPTLIIKIRDKDYTLENFFTLNTSEIDPNQSKQIKSRSTFMVSGFNFNTFYTNYLFINNEIPASSFFYIKNQESSQLIVESIDFISLGSDDDRLFGRNIELSIKSLGQFSKNKVKIEITDPVFPYQILPKSLLGRYSLVFFEQSFTSQVDNEIYLFVKSEIIKINHFDKGFSSVGILPIGFENILGGLFYQNTDDGKIIIGSQNKENTSNSNFIHLFDPQTNNVQRLNDIPEFTRTDFVRGSYYDNGFITIEIGKNRDGQVINEKWKLNISQNTWSFEGATDYKNGYISFQHNGEIYAFDDQYGSGIALNKLNPITNE